MKKKVLIVPSNTDLNRGDQSLTWESIEIAKDVFGNDVEVCLYKSGNRSSEIDNVNSQTEQLGHRILTRILAHPRRNNRDTDVNYNKFAHIKWIFIALYDMIVTLMLLSKFKFINKVSYSLLSKDQKFTYKYFEELDVVFVKGGGFLHSYGSLMDSYVMYFQLFDVFLANRLNKKVCILPNSVGPFKNKLAKYIVKKAFSKSSFISVREGVSFKYIEDLGMKSYLSPDLGFYLKPSENEFLEYLKRNGVDLNAEKKIAITLRPYRFDGESNSSFLYQQYINQFIEVIKELTNSGYHVSLVAHTIGPSAHEDDSIPLLEIYEEFRTNLNVTYLFDKDLDCRDIEKIYSYYDLVIGTRFHSVIFSVNVDTPAIAIAYGGNKAVGIMNDMGLGQYVLPIENPNSKVILQLAQEIFKDKEAYLVKTRKYKEVLIEKRVEIISLIQTSLN
uniref:polysaccharide pyruvyl transferase family protein n=1 Tax=Flavobacterium sp. TaxID=239 RepID=UPI00404AF9CD